MNIAFLESEIKYLKDQLELDSHNSSKPPSTDKDRKKNTTYLRKSTGLGEIKDCPFCGHEK